ncbi:Na+/H+ antiporter NhaC [Calditrichota bacterium]
MQVNHNERQKPSLFISLIPLITMALFLGIGYGVFQIKAEVLLIATAFISGLLGKKLGYSWKEMQEGIVESVTQAMPAMLIVICVGLLIGSWITSGTIPMLIYYGLKIISPAYFLVTACVVCSIVSLLTGTSWGTVGTIGIAFIGIAKGLGIPLAPTAGAIITGAYFGDKISPFSDTTNLAPIAARSNLFDHIRHLLWTTVPAWVIGLIIYFFVGLQYKEQIMPRDQMQLIFGALSNSFDFNLWLLLPLIVILFFAIKKLPTIPGMLIASLIAVGLALLFQKTPFNEVLNAMTTGFKADTGLAEVDKLLSRGGMMSMMGVTLIAFCAFAFAGIVQKTGMLQVILDRLLKFVHTTGMLIASASISSVIVAFITGSSFLSIIIPGELYAPAFRDRKLAAKNLSRTTEDSGTVVVPLVPWSMAGIFMAGTLGVPTLHYIGWSFMCYIGIIFALIYGFTGFAIAPKIREDETIPGS